MPLWHIYCPESVYSAEDKRAFATAITDLYAERGLPRFYVSVLFHEVPKELFFIGGKSTNDFVRIWIDQVARRVQSGQHQWWMDRVNTTINPFVRDRGYRWEIHIDETPIELWTIQGLKPPPPGPRLKSAGPRKISRRHLAERVHEILQSSQDDAKCELAHGEGLLVSLCWEVAA
jgi:phenylpyruvate tautomerase PptA (4-oxalocrotonate tautomerase family)